MLLRKATGGTHGPCLKYVRPCTPNTGSPCVGACGCTPVCEVTLAGYVSRIVQVNVDGGILPYDAYKLYNHSKLIRVDGGCFPRCQDMGATLDQPGTWGIWYYEGLSVQHNPLAKRAVTRLAVEIWKACGGDGECALPDRVTQVVREGVTYRLDNSDSSLDSFGIDVIDQFVDSVNPKRLRAPMATFSPDMPRRYYPVFELDRPMSVQVTPSSGQVPLDVTATVVDADFPPIIDWGD